MSDEINYVGERKGDELLNVAFSKVVTEQGSEIDYIRITIPGIDTTETFEPAAEAHKARFRRQWEEYTSLRQTTGTPIEDWLDIPENMRNEFKKRDFNYIEQVAKAPDSSLAGIMGGPTWRTKAQKFLEGNKITPEMVIDAQQQQIEDLKAQMADLMAAIQPKPRGRPALTEG